MLIWQTYQLMTYRGTGFLFWMLAFEYVESGMYYCLGWKAVIYIYYWCLENWCDKIVLKITVSVFDRQYNNKQLSNKWMQVYVLLFIMCNLCRVTTMPMRKQSYKINWYSLSLSLSLPPSISPPPPHTHPPFSLQFPLSVVRIHPDTHTE